MSSDARRGFPILTGITLTLTAATTATRVRGTAVLDALRRDPTALRSGQLWRLLSPVLVQTDHSVAIVVNTFALCAVVGVVGERFLTRPQWITLYLVRALVGHGIGEAFQPHQGGTSVAFAAILGGLAALALVPGTRTPLPLRIEAAIVIPLAIVDTSLRDIHGLPFLAGLGVATIWFRHSDGISRKGDHQPGGMAGNGPPG